MRKALKTVLCVALVLALAVVIALRVLPPLLYGIIMLETELDASGQVVNVSVVRKPAADEVAPWVLAMVRRAAPDPAPGAMPGATVRLTETWFVDRSGLFQLFSLTEGQK